MKFFVNATLAVALILSTGCGYRVGYGPLSSRYHSISVPYVCGDNDGYLTAALVERLATGGGFTYCPKGGQLQLNVRILDLRDENIGFRYDRNKKGKPTHFVIPAETRMTATAEVEVIERCSGQVILGPVIITESVDFDHDYYASTSVNVFSLGQVTDIEAAKDAAVRPLNRRLAAKIVDYLNASW